MLADTLVSRCGVRRGNVQVEVTMPSNFLLTFAKADDCTQVLFIYNFSCGGACLSFRRWNRLVHAGSDKLRYLTKLTIDGLSVHATGQDEVKQILNSLECQLVEMEAMVDACTLSMLVWAANPNRLPKELLIEVPERDLLPQPPG
ncbi:hypothetical protein E2562_029330 [Oryza meyeriana var. granulata]|uniref:Uncharacterized protein n=1 Tax=Oryza meyeriana var. granulata TaxID=110450 RepID=A0A6G1E611_9ORYZ|nr:hypothetical protein E2562_029330 [Oryza meyeriana var. granulata]